jgi:hypothetical protein
MSDQPPMPPPLLSLGIASFDPMRCASAAEPDVPGSVQLPADDTQWFTYSVDVNRSNRSFDVSEVVTSEPRPVEPSTWLSPPCIMARNVAVVFARSHARQP